MIVTANDIRFQRDEQNRVEVVIATGLRKIDITQAKASIAKGKLLSVEIKEFRKKRSLDANAYLWVLLSKLADALHTTKDELYLQVLERYGVFTHIIVKPNVVEKFKQEWRTVRELGEVKVNGQTGVQLQCYFGSSTYTTKEMATLIDGVVSECKEAEIETLPPDEIARIKSQWGV